MAVARLHQQQRPPETGKAYSVRFGSIVHSNGKRCTAWHAFAGGVQVGGCGTSKAEALRELADFRRSERAAIDDL